MEWISFKWKPKYEGPYLLKFEMPSPKIKGKIITRYFIKRYTVSLKPYKYKGRNVKPLHGPYGYFSSGTPTFKTMTPIAWMPIEGHDYMKLKKNQELESRLYNYQKIS